MLVLPPGADRTHVAAVRALVDRHGHDRGALLAVLQEIQHRYGQVDDLAMQVVADELGVAPVDVLGVATFYSFLRGTHGTHVLRVCRTLTCAMAGATAVGARLASELGVPMGSTTPDGSVTAEWVHCIGQCDRAPAMLVDDEAVGDLTPGGVAAIAAAVRATGTRGSPRAPG